MLRPSRRSRSFKLSLAFLCGSFLLMATGSWATPAEREFLASLIPEYEACQVKRRYKAFWQRLDAEFLVKFPVLEKLFPDRSVKAHDLQPHEKEIYAAAVLKQHQVSLSRWRTLRT
jgi:hypothetical protein